jgi:transcriptional regulator with XRE-family HTH domain
MEISEKIKKIRDDNNLSQEKFADKIGVSHQTVISYEKGTSIPQTHTLITICNEFHLDMNYFVDQTNLGNYNQQDIINQNDELLDTNITKKTDEEFTNNQNNSKECIKEIINLNYKTYEKEFNRDIKELKLKKHYILRIIIFLFTLMMIFFLIGLGLWFLSLPLIVLILCIRKKLAIKWYINYYSKKLNKIYKDNYPISPQYYIYLKFMNDGIYIYKNNEIIFYCPYEQYDHHTLIINFSHTTQLINLSQCNKYTTFTLAIFTKDTWIPYEITFPLFYKNKLEKKALLSMNIISYIKTLNDVSFLLNKKTKSE